MSPEEMTRFRRELEETLKPILDTICEAVETAAVEMDRLKDALVEERAKAIYARMPYDEKGTKPDWVEGGNSIKQDEARKQARALLLSDVTISAPVVPHRTSS